MATVHRGGTLIATHPTRIFVDDRPLARIPADEWRTRLAGALMGIQAIKAVEVGAHPRIGAIFCLKIGTGGRVDQCLGPRIGIVGGNDAPVNTVACKRATPHA